MTSHDVVGFIRKLLKTKKVGHTGTLDPAVTGVLPLCLGKGTKVVQYLTDSDKTYRGEITFGIATDTQDASGQVIKTIEAEALEMERVTELFRQFTGELWQIPPMVSAVKVNGKKLYEYARQGLEIHREPRKICIYSLNILGHKDFGTAHPKVQFDVECSKGTYIRTLCADIGNKSGYGAHMSSLIRIKAGPFTIEKALNLEQISQLCEEGNIESVIIPYTFALSGLPEVFVFDDLVDKIKHGNRIYAPGVASMPPGIKAGERVCLKSSIGECLAVAEAFLDETDCSRMHFQPVKVFL